MWTNGKRFVRALVVVAAGGGLIFSTGTPVSAAPAPGDNKVTRTVITYQTDDPALVDNPKRMVETLLRDGNLDRLGVAPGDDTLPQRTKPTAEYGTRSEKFADTGDITTQTTFPYDYITRSECRDNSNASRTEGWIKNHFAYCQKTAVSGIAIECTLFPPGCRPVGAYAATAMTIGYGKQGERTADFDFILDGLVATGVFLRTSSDFEVEIRCSGGGTGGCAPGSPSSRDSSFVSWLADPVAKLQLVSPASAPDPALGEQKATGVFRMHYEVDLSGFTDASGDLPEGGMRFDSATYLPYKEGSIFDRTMPWLSYSVTDSEVSYSAWNIYNAQNFPADTQPLLAGKQLAGESASDPLHRLYHDKSRRKANRAEATAFCRSQWPGYSDLGQDCDEYAFACTYEGAARYKYDGAQYKNHFAVRPIPAYDNQEAGRRLGVWYGNDRILDSDPFYVRIFGASGSAPAPPTGTPVPPDDAIVDCGDGTE